MKTFPYEIGVRRGNFLPIKTRRKMLVAGGVWVVGRQATPHVTPLIREVTPDR